eukprot:CAMPEP_0178408104 /NCGR_PEP_ID=MMETSP0689_2-20121128/19768_1 /TAXON_ID=160604 /ORGANISM="Amphidinium massartii, Strain CS-259" /LENGTH=346 /DNA_ID=CAMNT_0020029191 /DNA_START=110 /DNA_END=1151 /DNA_ORIENTATION=-
MPKKEMLGTGGRQSALARCSTLLKQLPVTQLAMIEPTLRMLADESAGNPKSVRRSHSVGAVVGGPAKVDGIVPPGPKRRGTRTPAAVNKLSSNVNAQSAPEVEPEFLPARVAPVAATAPQRSDPVSNQCYHMPASAAAVVGAPEPPQYSRAMSDRKSAAETSGSWGGYPTWDDMCQASEPSAERPAMPRAMSVPAGVQRHEVIASMPQRPQHSSGFPDKGIGYIARARRRQCQAGVGAADAMRSWGAWRMWQSASSNTMDSRFERQAALLPEPQYAPYEGVNADYRDGQQYVEIPRPGEALQGRMSEHRNQRQFAQESGWRDLGGEGFEFDLHAAVVEHNPSALAT